MLASKTKAALTASALAVTALCISAPGSAQEQQPVSGGVQGGHVSAGTSGYGSTDGTSIVTGGTGDAAATNGGTADTQVRSQTNDRRGMTRATANARDDDERARSRTMTTVRNGEVVRSRTHSMYKQKGEPPVREFIRSTSTPEGTTTNSKGSSKPPKGE